PPALDEPGGGRTRNECDSASADTDPAGGCSSHQRSASPAVQGGHSVSASLSRSATTRIVAGRSLGCFARQSTISCERSRGTVSGKGAGASVTTIAKDSTAVLPRNAARPASRKYPTAPSAKTSHERVGGLPETSSGAAYPGVPANSTEGWVS